MQIQTIDWDLKRIYLHIDTVTQGYKPIDLYFEHNALIQANANNEQNYYAACTAEGNAPKGGGNFTPAYLFLFTGWRIVPYDTDHTLLLTGETVGEEEISDRDVFDRSSLASSVGIDPVYSEVEIREINTGSVLTIEQAQKIQRILDILEADEEPLESTYTKRHKTTKEILVSKNVIRSGNQVIGLVDP